MEMEEGDPLVDSKGNCFLCLEPLRTTTYAPPGGMGMPPSSSSSSYSLRQLARHLKMDMEKVLSYHEGKTGIAVPPEMLGKVERSQLKVELCDECICYAERFSGLHRQLEEIQGKVTSVVKLIHGRFRKAEESGISEQFSRKLAACSGNGGGLGKLDITEGLRMEAMQKCALYLDPPTVDQPGSGTHAREINKVTGPEGRSVGTQVGHTTHGQQESGTNCDPKTGDDGITSEHSVSEENDNDGGMPARENKNLGTDGTAEPEIEIQSETEVETPAVGTEMDEDQLGRVQISSVQSLRVGDDDSQEGGSSQGTVPDPGQEAGLESDPHATNESVPAQPLETGDEPLPRKMASSSSSVIPTSTGNGPLTRKMTSTLGIRITPDSRPPKRKKLPGSSSHPKNQQQLSHKSKSIKKPRKNWKSNPSEMPYHCKYCGKGLSRKAHLHDHERSHTGETPFACPHCPERFPSSSSCKAHQFLHRAESRCVFCNFQARSPRGLEDHVRTHTLEKPFSCGECGKEFSNKEGLRHCEKKHAGGFRCDVCGRTYARANLRTKHVCKPKTSTKPRETLKAETGSNPVMTGDGHVPPKMASSSSSANPITGKRPLTQKTGSTSAIRIRPPGKFLCTVCGKRFSRSTTLRYHEMSSHTGKTPFACSQCPKKFSNSGALKAHQFVHTAESRCVFCNFQCSSPQSMENHLRTHTKEKPFTCPECGKEFAFKQNLIYCRNKHAGGFPCELCGRTYSSEYNRKVHRCKKRRV